MDLIPRIMNLDIAATEDNLLEALRRASSQDAAILKPAEAKLREWEVQPGFYSALLNIIATHDLDLNIRWMAVLYMKNGIDKYWRKSAPNAISEDEKTLIKRGLISSFNEPVNQIATQRAVLVARIARIDCPKEWEELLPTLLQMVLSNDILIQHRSILTLQHVIKSISSRRLMGDRRIFQDFTTNIYSFIVNLWNTFTDLFISNICQNENVELTISNLEKAVLTLKILRKLTVYGLNRPHENRACLDFLKVLFDKTKSALECRKQLKGKGIYVLELCEKYINHSTKVLISLLENHPFSFVSLIHSSLEFTMYYLFTPEGIQYTYERFSIQCFNIIKGILHCNEYKPGKNVQSMKYSEMVHARDIKLNFFQPNILTEICRRLVTHYFILNQDELDMWDTDPETFANDEIGDSWKYSLRPSMETVFVTMFHEFRDILAPVLLDLIRETSGLVPPEDMPGILKKDAVYNAVALAAFDLYEEVDFDQWFTTTLSEELKIKHNNYRIIRRRVSVLMGKWAGIKLSPKLRPSLYECVINLLSCQEDMAVRLTASSTLRFAIDDFEFDAEQFKDYLEASFNLLFQLLKEVSECETKMHILNVMTLIVERVGHTIQPHSDALIQYLPLIWKESDDHNMLRCAIVSTLVQLVKALGTVVPELTPFLMPIIMLGTDPKQSAIVYLLEDSLELWLTVLENSSCITNELIQLFDNVPSLLDYSTEAFNLCITICSVHTLLAPELVMRSHGVQIMTVCNNMMADMKNEGIMSILRVAELYLRASPSLGAETVLPILPRIFEGVYEGEKYPMVMSMYITVVSRVLISSHTVFSQVLSRLASVHNESEEIVMSKILRVWLLKMPNVSQTEQRKVMALALANLLTIVSRPTMEMFGNIMIQILEALNDVTKTDENGIISDCLVLNRDRSPSYFYEETDGLCETEHDQRKKQLIYTDPVHTIVLKEYFQSQMFSLKNQLGLPQYEQLLSLVDADTMSQLKEYISF
ncbi:importin-11 [Coccinella septempunctata]|uniref:importin-11 n=1 Tax=Coccinella septempunctata TaxID=41139 RepID=UPI001D05E1D5|nr:importin-11 [Coccinella septempunctata]XP_044757045.1 importin-11 [Coccinella septempunctata]